MNTVLRKFESPQKDESRTQSAGSLKAYTKSVLQSFVIVMLVCDIYNKSN